MWSKFILWLKKLFRVFIFDSGLFEKGIDKVIEELLKQGIKASDNFKDWMDILLEQLKLEFSNIKPIVKWLDALVHFLNTNWGSYIDHTKGGIKVKLEVLKEKIMEYVEHML